ncbi:twin-arginine translocase TatA/TatE family subunit [Halomarina litorea]|uniref:twin-arginine translocase TatA/TatE family subunit n=1 Tax=Halomarina litorea TaxID=2961595 RepID=UPI0020C34B33|nr:twin-arginine translocase TatA/TatE family subunit [Halomarina sp. BCD28]
MFRAVIAQFAPIPGGMELLIILFIILLLFGANKVPKLARSAGQAMGEYQKGRQTVEEELAEMRTGAVGTEDDVEFDAETVEGEDDPDLDIDMETTDDQSSTLDKESAA